MQEGDKVKIILSEANEKGAKWETTVPRSRYGASNVLSISEYRDSQKNPKTLEITISARGPGT